MTIPEIVEDVIKLVGESDRKFIQANREDMESVWFDSAFSRWIRNEYKLWSPDNPLTMLNYVPELRKVQINEHGDLVDDAEGVECDCNPRHPDSVSAKIQKEVYQRIRAE